MFNFENKVISEMPCNMAPERKRGDWPMSKQEIDKIEYLVLLVAEFAAQNRVSEATAYRYLNQYGALALCNKHYEVMHTLSVEDNIHTLQEYCQRRGGNL